MFRTDGYLSVNSLVGDINEDQLKCNTHKLKDILTLNNIVNIITEPTRETEHSRTL